MTNALRLTNFSRQAGLNKTRKQWVYNSVDSETLHLVLLLQKTLKNKRVDFILVFSKNKPVQKLVACCAA